MILKLDILTDFFQPDTVKLISAVAQLGKWCYIFINYLIPLTPFLEVVYSAQHFLGRFL